ncbi:hypothetical protein CJJ09_001863 [Candidozyma auris]|nr:hypothetical protein CJJ09_001863 [[Candida] auris]
MPKVVIISSDEEKFPVDVEVATKSVLIKNMISDLKPDLDEDDEDFEIPTPNVRANVLAKVLEWCEHHKNTVFPDDDDEDARKSASPLLDAGCKIIAEMIKHKSPEELRKTFNIVNDFSPEEEAAIRKENEWAEDR